MSLLRAVRARILELTVEQAKAANMKINENDLSSIVEEAIEWARDVEDFYWGMKAQQAAIEGFLGPEESERKLKEYAKKAGIKTKDKTRKKA